MTIASMPTMAEIDTAYKQAMETIENLRATLLRAKLAAKTPRGVRRADDRLYELENIPEILRQSALRTFIE